MKAWLKGGLIYSVIILISTIIRFFGGIRFSIAQILVIIIAFIVGSFVGKIHESSKQWSYQKKFASLFASYSVLISILGLMWAGSLEWFLVFPAPTYIITVFGYMGYDRPSIWLITKINTITVITSALVWFIIGQIIGWIVGKIKARNQQPIPQNLNRSTS